MVSKGVHVSAQTNHEFVKSILHKDALRTTGKYIELMYERCKELMKKVDVPEKEEEE